MRQNMTSWMNQTRSKQSRNFSTFIDWEIKEINNLRFYTDVYLHFNLVLFSYIFFLWYNNGCNILIIQNSSKSDHEKKWNFDQYFTILNSRLSWYSNSPYIKMFVYFCLISIAHHIKVNEAYKCIRRFLYTGWYTHVSSLWWQNM